MKNLFVTLIVTCALSPSVFAKRVKDPSDSFATNLNNEISKIRSSNSEYSDLSAYDESKVCNATKKITTYLNRYLKYASAFNFKGSANHSYNDLINIRNLNDNACVRNKVNISRPPVSDNAAVAFISNIFADDDAELKFQTLTPVETANETIFNLIEETNQNINDIVSLEILEIANGQDSLQAMMDELFKPDMPNRRFTSERCGAKISIKTDISSNGKYMYAHVIDDSGSYSFKASENFYSNDTESETHKKKTLITEAYLNLLETNNCNYEYEYEYEYET
jgi:hypothetical protein